MGTKARGGRVVIAGISADILAKNLYLWNYDESFEI
jgi:hypothetical protein